MLNDKLGQTAILKTINMAAFPLIISSHIYVTGYFFDHDPPLNPCHSWNDIPKAKSCKHYNAIIDKRPKVFIFNSWIKIKRSMVAG